MADSGKLSATKIGYYKGCPLAFFLKYVEHEKVPTNVRFVFGKGIHYMLERFYKVNYKSPDSFAGYWKFYWISSVAGDFLKGKQKRELTVTEHPTKKGSIKIGDHVDLGPDPVGLLFGYMRLGENILKRFYTRHKDKPPPLSKEASFGVKNDEPMEIGGHLIRGVFDRIDKNEQGYYVTDYKTTKKSPEENSFVLHRDPQFTLYSYAFRKLFGQEENSVLYYHLRSGTLLKTHRSQKDYDYICKVLDEVVEGVEKDVFTPFYGYHCGYCDYQIACEKYSIPYHGGPRIDLEGKIKHAKIFDWDAEFPDWIEMQTEN